MFHAFNKINFVFCCLIYFVLELYYVFLYTLLLHNVLTLYNECFLKAQVLASSTSLIREHKEEKIDTSFVNEQPHTSGFS